tara:strand:- start:79 stop:438 length:360 start_codon:yes stop_codon:yes gene_type:complete
MKKQETDFTNLSKKELEYLKDIYITEKVKSMNNNQLRDFVIEHISLQIKNTIGKEEELEAWQEMEIFFKEDFQNIIKNVQIKFEHLKEAITPSINNLERSQILESINNEDSQKEDMWVD